MSTEKPTMWRSVMLSTMGRSPRRGRVTLPHQAVMPKSTTAAIPERRATDQSGDRLWRMTLFTGQVRPHVRTTATSRMIAWRNPVSGGGIGRGAEPPFELITRRRAAARGRRQR